MTIDLSPETQKLITELTAVDPSLIVAFSNSTSIDKKDLLIWLTQTSNIPSSHKAFFLIASLRASLLKDIHRTLNPGPTKADTQKGGITNKILYGLLGLAGTIYFGCEGFDGVTALLASVSSVPNIALFAVGTLCSIISIIVFYSFDLVAISKNLGIQSADTKKLLDVLVDEVEQIKAVRLRLSKTVKKTKEELEDDLLLAKILLQRYMDLEQVRKGLTSASNHPVLKGLKYATAIIAGVLFFSGGFFAGQTVALAIAGLIVTGGLAACAWPILLVSIAVGLAALSVYWFVERPGIENLISRWKGLDKKKMDRLCKSDIVNEEKEDLEELIKSIDFKIEAIKQHESDQKEIESLGTCTK